MIDDREYLVGTIYEDTSKKITYILMSIKPYHWAAFKYELVSYPELDIINQEK